MTAAGVFNPKLDALDVAVRDARPRGLLGREPGRSAAAPGPLSRFVVVLAGVLLAAGAFACAGGGAGGGGGDGGTAVRMVLEADLSALPAGADTDAVMKGLAVAVQTRARAFGAPDVQAEREGASHRVSVAMSTGASDEDLRRLMENNVLLELRRPLLDDRGRIVCQAPGGHQFSVQPESVGYVTSGVRKLPVCAEVGGEQVGNIVWEPVGGQGQGQAGAFFRPVAATVDRTEAPVLVVSFLPDTARFLEEITGAMTGLPLGIFLSEELVAAPTVSAPLSQGNLAIGGLSLAEASIVTAQITGGDLPVPVKVVDIQRTP